MVSALAAKTLLKEKALQEKVGLSSRTLFQEFVQSLVRLSFETVVNSSWRMSRVFRLKPDCREVAWQLIAVNIKRQTSADIKVIKEKLLGLDHTRKRIPTILSLQETKSWNVPNLELPGCVGCGSKLGFATLLVSKQFCTVKRSWKSEERCTAILFGTTMVMAVYAPDSKKRLEIKYFEEVARAVPRTSTLQQTSMWNWVWCAQMKTERRSSRKCMVPFARKDTTKTLAVSTKSCGMESWKNLIVRCPVRGLYVVKGEQRLEHTGTQVQKRKKNKFHSWTTSSGQWEETMKSASTTQEDYGQRGIIILFLREHKKRHTKIFQERNKKWTGWKPITEEQSVKFKKKWWSTTTVLKKISQEHRERSQESSARNESTKRKRNNEYSRECQAARRSCRKVYSKNQTVRTQEASEEG